MYQPITTKICGLTREEDVDLALTSGADYFGFIVYPGSPRAITLERAVELASAVPKERCVLVSVEPSSEEMESFSAAGFGAYQIHARGEASLASLAVWSGLAGRERLWFAPRLKPDQLFPEFILEFTDTVVMDSYSAGQVGGTGKTGDWAGFRTLRESYQAIRWILAGGIGPDNIQAALAASGTSFVDVNSGVETAPGIKDAVQMEALYRALHS